MRCDGEGGFFEVALGDVLMRMYIYVYMYEGTRRIPDRVVETIHSLVHQVRYQTTPPDYLL